jgi:hypothetical protein
MTVHVIPMTARQYGTVRSWFATIFKQFLTPPSEEMFREGALCRPSPGNVCAHAAAPAARASDADPFLRRRLHTRVRRRHLKVLKTSLKLA